MCSDVGEGRHGYADQIDWMEKCGNFFSTSCLFVYSCGMRKMVEK
jgi:hypothetical protein